MLVSKRDKILTATQNANDKFAKAAKREEEFQRERGRLQQLDAAKTARLKALRLAKEAADRETQERESGEKKVADVAARLARRPRKAQTA
ncbi:MAG: hypothetical protein ACREFC_04160 [Stellaceae bacterium]